MLFFLEKKSRLLRNDVPYFNQWHGLYSSTIQRKPNKPPLSERYFDKRSNTTTKTGLENGAVINLDSAKDGSAVLPLPAAP